MRSAIRPAADAHSRNSPKVGPSRRRNTPTCGDLRTGGAVRTAGAAGPGQVSASCPVRPGTTGQLTNSCPASPVHAEAKPMAAPRGPRPTPTPPAAATPQLAENCARADRGRGRPRATVRKLPGPAGHNGATYGELPCEPPGRARVGVGLCTRTRQGEARQGRARCGSPSVSRSRCQPGLATDRSPGRPIATAGPPHRRTGPARPEPGPGRTRWRAHAHPAQGADPAPCGPGTAGSRR